MSLLSGNITYVAFNFYLSNLFVLFFHGCPQVDWVLCDRNRRPWKGSLRLEGLGDGCTTQVYKQTQTELQYVTETHGATKSDMIPYIVFFLVQCPVKTDRRGD